MDSLMPIVLALAPSVGIGYLFYRVMRALLEGDRAERLAHSRWLAEQSQDSTENLSSAPSAKAGTIPAPKGDGPDR
ncbi:MAG: hypothetical protein ABI746_08165 [Dermatophilaceae bacterium]